MGIVRRVLGALLLVYGSVLLLWVGYNVYVEMSAHFSGRSVGSAFAMVFGSLFVGWRWVRGRTAFDGTDGTPRELPSEIAPEVAVAYPSAHCRCGMGRFLKLRDEGLWCGLCDHWVVAPLQEAGAAEPGAAPDRCT